MTLGQALVRRKELVVRKNILETRLVEAQSYRASITDKTEINRIYDKTQFDTIFREVIELRKEIADLKKAISKANIWFCPEKKICVQDLIIEVGTLRDHLNFLNELRKRCRDHNYDNEVIQKTVMSAAELDELIDEAQREINEKNKEITSLNSKINLD